MDRTNISKYPRIYPVYPSITCFRNEWTREQWNKHTHVRWLRDMSQKLTKDSFDFLKTQFNIKTRSALKDAKEAQERYRNIVTSNGVRERRIVYKLLEEISDWLVEKVAAQKRGDVLLLDLDMEKYVNYLKEVRDTKIPALKTKLEKIDKELEQKFDQDVTPKCPVTSSKIDDLTSNLDSVSFSGQEKIETINNECQEELNKYFKAMRPKYGTLEEEYNEEFEEIKKKESELGTSLVRQASTTDDRWDYNDNIFDIMIRNNEDLITALVGKFPADENKNILTGMEVNMMINLMKKAY